MPQNRLPRLLSLSLSSGESRLRDSIDQSQLTGLACVLVGASQLPLAFLVGEQSLILFVMGCAGWMLIGLGVDLLRGKEAFETGWGESERIEWLSAAWVLLFALFVVAATAVVLLGA
ncbi:hypothetical protein ACFQE1_04710 [Halobium palmae]|uniref:Uncharacterized protein n=1 Tax=Halobium palmae TaxID=1776492 RepID=A0ABD5RWW0_9EURY